MKLGKYEISDLQTWLQSRRIRWEELRISYQGAQRLALAFELVEIIDDCEALADALEEK